MNEAGIGTFELHVFVEPFDPSPELAARFSEACQRAPTPMKGLLLKLDYVHRGFLGVLQSSRYVTCTLDEAKREAHLDAEHLGREGFTVIREKIEAVAEKNPLVPREPADVTASPGDRYFEFHVLIDGKGRALSEEDMVSLRGLSREFSARLNAPVPLSYNVLKPSQRFLNMRARGVTFDEALGPVNALQGRIAASGELEVKKLICEYICFDTNRAVDNGWTEPLP